MAQDRRPLTVEDREEISRYVVLGLKNKEIAAALDRHDWDVWAACTPSCMAGM